ncbi:MAG: acyl carrier protein [Bacteroidia bacterium]|nr:acyl carrier protein [Bacteroidia bacterium]MDW8348484.1 acyl carrier protein [Bacteroidia bacterium]
MTVNHTEYIHNQDKNNLYDDVFLFYFAYMTAEQVLQEIHPIFHDILEDDTIILTRETTAHQVDGWDSLSHIDIIVAIEKHFGIRFTSAEIASFKNVGDLVDCVAKKKS